MQSTGGFPLALGDPHLRSGEDSIVAAANQLSSLDEMASRRSPRKRKNQNTGFTSSEPEPTDTQDENSQTGDDSEPAAKRGRRSKSASSASNRKTEDKGKSARNPILTKVIKKKANRPRKSMKDMNMQELCHEWNTQVKVGLPSQTAAGWLKKMERKRNAQGQLLRKATPGAQALKEIRHYQRCQTFLIAVIPFQQLVREVCDQCDVRNGDIRWQSNTLFTLQGAAEAYMGGFFHDVNLCALHRKVKTINRKDVTLAIEIRGSEHVGGKPQMSDVGVVNTSRYRIADASEKSALDPR